MQHVTLVHHQNPWPGISMLRKDEPVEFVLPDGEYKAFKGVIKTLFDKRSVALIRQVHQQMKRRARA